MDRVVFFEIEEWEKEHIQNSDYKIDALYTGQKAQEATDSSLLQSSVISTFIYSELNRETLSKFPNLKFIATRSTGYDHVDLEYCKEKNIIVSNVPVYGAHAVAEHTFALILAISRKIIPTIEKSRRSNFELEGLRGFDLNGKTIGVVGLGKIGKKVVDLSLAFGMNVLVHTKNPGQNQDKIRFVQLEELLSTSDIISLHIPHTAETHHMINRENMKKFKKGSILINTARGPLVETQAILEGLQSGILRAVGLDALEEECGLKEERELLTDEYFKSCDIKTQLLDHVLLSRDDVFYTSHNAFNTDEALAQILETTLSNIRAFKGGKPENNVNAEEQIKIN
jgi:D-lactate dehydrogenase